MWDLSTLDPSEDADLFDGIEQVLYEPKNIGPPEAYYTGVMIPCLVRELTEVTQAIDHGESAIREGRFDIWTSSLYDTPDGTFRPHRRDRITRYDADGTATELWYVQEVKTSTLGTRYPLQVTEGVPVG